SICSVFAIEPETLRNQLNAMRIGNFPTRRLRSVGRRTALTIPDQGTHPTGVEFGDLWRVGESRSRADFLPLCGDAWVAAIPRFDCPGSAPLRQLAVRACVVARR